MTRRCVVTQKVALVGNNVSHANNHVKRRFETNIQVARLYSELLGRGVNVRVSVKGLRTVDHKGGLDAWLLNTAPSKLDPTLRPIRAQIKKKADAQKAAAK